MPAVLCYAYCVSVNLSLSVIGGGGRCYGQVIWHWVLCVCVLVEDCVWGNGRKRSIVMASECVVGSGGASCSEHTHNAIEMQMRMITPQYFSNMYINTGFSPGRGSMVSPPTLTFMLNGK